MKSLPSLKKIFPSRQLQVNLRKLRVSYSEKVLLRTPSPKRQLDQVLSVALEAVQLVELELKNLMASSILVVRQPNLSSPQTSSRQLHPLASKTIPLRILSAIVNLPVTLKRLTTMMSSKMSRSATLRSKQAVEITAILTTGEREVHVPSNRNKLQTRKRHPTARVIWMTFPPVMALRTSTRTMTSFEALRRA